ncbi:MAG: translocation/assembly module TamB domain-containing protein [Oligoflexus sp.]
MPKKIRVLLILAIVLTAMAFIANMAVDNPYGHQLVRKAINTELAKHSNLKLDFKALSLNFAPPGVRIYGVSVTVQGSEERVLETSRLQFNVSWTSLFVGQAKLGTIRLHELRVAYPFPENVKFYPTESAKPKVDKPTLWRWPPDTSFPLSRIVLVDSSIQLGLGSADTSELVLQLDGLNLDWTISNWQSWELDLEANRINLFIDKKHILQDTEIFTKLSARHTEINSEYFHAKSHRLDLSGALTAELELLERKFDPLSARLFFQEIIGLHIKHRFKLERGDIEILGDYLGSDKSQGDVSGKGQVSLHIPFDERPLTWNIRGKAQSHQAKLAGFKLLDSKITFLIDSKGFFFQEAEVFEGDTSLAEGSGEILFEEGVPIRFNISPYKLPFKALMSILQVEDFEPIQMQLNARDLVLSGKAIPFQLQLTGSGHFHNITTPIIQHSQHQYKEGPRCTMNIDLRINNKRLLMQKADGFCSIPAEQQALSETEGTSSAPKFSRLQLSGHFNFDTQGGMDFKIEIPQADARISQHFTNMKTRGLIDAEAHFIGPYDQFRIDMQLNTSKFRLWDETYERLQFAGTYLGKERLLKLRKARLSLANNSFIDVSNSAMGFQKSINYDGLIQAKQIPKATISNWMRNFAPTLPLEFNVRELNAQIKGPITNLDQILGQVNAEIGELSYQEERLASLLRVNLTRNKEGISIPNFYARLDLLEITGSVIHKHHHHYERSTQKVFSLLGIGQKDPIKLSLQSAPVQTQTETDATPSKSEWNHLGSLPFIGSIFKDIQFGGDIVFQTDLDGTIKRLDGQIQGSLENLYVFDSPIASINFSGFIRGSRIELPVLRHSGNALVGRFSLDFLAPGIPYEWYFDLNQFDFRAIFGPMFAKDPRNFAYLSAFWRMEGRFQDWWESKGELRVDSIAINYINEVLGQARKIELISDKEIRVAFDSKGWNFSDGKSLKLEGEHFSVELMAENNKPPQRLNLNFQSAVNLQVLRHLFPQVETARGQVVLNGSLTGSVAEPNIQVSLRDRKLDPFKSNNWEPVSIGLADLPPAFTNIGIDAKFDNGILRVQRLTANKGQQGTILVSGNLNLSDDSSTASQLLMEIERIEMNRLDIPLLNAADTTLSGSLNLTGNHFPFRLSGDVRLDRVHSIGNFDLRKQIIQALYRKRYSAPTATRSAYLDLDVELSAEKTMYIRNRNMEATLSAELQIQGSETEPIILGQISTENGNFIYKRTFDINRGIISFDEPTSPPNPKLDIIGDVQVENYNVEVNISGTASDPRVNFSIDPPTRPDGSAISNVDIIVLLTSGQLPSSSDTSPIKVASNEALSLFVGFAEGPLEKIFDASGQSFVRQVYIDSYLSETESRPITRLNLPIHINEDLRIVFQVDDDENFKQSFQYSLHENINVSGSIDKKKEDKSRNERNLPADTVVDLKFRFKFD